MVPHPAVRPWTKPQHPASPVWSCTPPQGQARHRMILHPTMWSSTPSHGPAPLHGPAPHCMALHPITWPCTPSHGPASHYMALHPITWLCTPSYGPAPCHTSPSIPPLGPSSLQRLTLCSQGNRGGWSSSTCFLFYSTHILSPPQCFASVAEWAPLVPASGFSSGAVASLPAILPLCPLNP